MATVTNQGFTGTDLTAYLALIQAGWLAIFGEDLNLDPDTPQAQLTGADALLLTEMDQAIQDLASSLDIAQAQGQQLDDLCTILSIIRKPAINSNVNAEMTGTPLATVLVGAQAKLSTGEVFELQADVVFDGAGEGTGFFEALDAGAVAVPINSLTTIVTPVPGWDTIDNAAAGATGVEAEQDFQFRRRYFAQLAINAVTPIESLIAGVFEIDEVTDVAGFENDQTTPQVIEGVSVAAHSVAMAVIGGSDADVAGEIRRRKTIGTGTVGTTNIVVPVYKPGTTVKIQDLTINFYRVTSIPAKVDVDITVGANFPSNGEQLIKDNLVAYFNGSDQFVTEFELDGLQIAEDVFRSRLYTPVNRVPGHVINSLDVLKVTYPTWLIGTTYDLDDIVEGSDTNIYISLAGSNLGNDPISEPTWWEEITTEEAIVILLNEKATLDEDDVTVTTS